MTDQLSKPDTEMQPCPFCGKTRPSIGVILGFGQKLGAKFPVARVECVCGAHGSTVTEPATASRAVEAWNTRPAVPAQQKPSREWLAARLLSMWKAGNSPLQIVDEVFGPLPPHDSAQQVQLSPDEDAMDAVGIREKFRAIRSKEAQFIALCVGDWIEKQFKALAPAPTLSQEEKDHG